MTTHCSSDYGYTNSNHHCRACGSVGAYCCDGQGGSWSEFYRGVRIMRDKDDGFFAEHGNESFGYADTIEEIKSEIDDYMHGPEDQRARQAIGWE